MRLDIGLNVLAPKMNTNMADNNAAVDDAADILTISALLADEKLKSHHFSQ